MRRKELFKYYIFGYLNVFYNATRLLDGKSYKEYRINHVINYLHLNQSLAFVFKRISSFFIVFEIPLSILIVTIFFIKALALKPFKRINHKLTIYSIIYGLDCNFYKFVSMLSCSHVDTTNLVVVTSPFINNTAYKRYQNESVLSRVSFTQILISFHDSLKMIFFMCKRYHKNDFFFRSYSFFEYSLAYYYFSKIDNSIPVYFYSLIDRWAFFFGNLSNRTIFLQHGMMTDIKLNTFLRKIGKADVGYFINVSQMEICKILLFNNQPEVHYLKTMSFSHNEVLKENGKINVLLICNYRFREMEEKLMLEYLSPYDINLYVKPHPKDNYAFYRKLSEQREMIILGRDFFPKVDVVLSYDSSLAVEYEDLGIKVLRYTSKDFLNTLKTTLS